MKKILLIAGLAIAVIVAAAITLVYKTKSHSPASLASFDDGNVMIQVQYHSPSKKGRKIIGALVPYGKTWRTGANEPTVFETDRPLLISGKVLKPGKYSLWTVPNEDSWLVIFNSKVPAWGINVLNHGIASRDLEADAIIVNVPVMITEKEFEKFNISIEKTDDMLELVLAWDRTLVAVPFTII